MKKIPGWVDELKENDFERFLNNEKILDDVPFFTDEKIKKMIYDKSIYEKENKNILKKIFNKQFFKYSISFAILLVLIVTAVFIFPVLYNNFILNKNVMTCKVVKINGKVSVINKKNKKITVLNNDVIKERIVLLTDKRSSIELLIEDGSLIKLNEFTKLKIKKIRKIKNVREQEYRLYNGEITLRPEKIANNSRFEILTDYFTIGAKGTVFDVGIDDNKNYKISVKEGEVYLKLNKSKKIRNALRKLPEDISNKIDTIFNEEIILKENQSLDLTYDNINDMNENILKIINEINKYTSDDKIIEKKLKINLIINNYIIIKSGNQDVSREDADNIISKIEDGKNKINYNIIKINNLKNIKLEEKNTAVTTDGKNIFIISKINKKIFCINPVNGKIKWIYKSSTGNLTSPVINYKNKIVFAKPDSMDILNNIGKLTDKYEINKGPNYWGYPVILQDILYIPGQENIYIYNGNVVKKLDYIPDSLGQIYISALNEKLVCNYSLEKKLYLCDTINNKIIFTFDKIKNRSFNTPLLNLNYIYTADNNGYLYKIDYTSSTKYKELYIKNGVISNIVLLNNTLYFTANNGFLYSVNNSKFDEYSKIDRIENNNDLDKYLNKKLIVYKNKIFYCSDFGQLLFYDPEKKIIEKINVNVNVNSKAVPLICTPVIINSSIYFVDIKSNIYKFDLFD